MPNRKIKHIQSKKRTVGDVHVSKNGTYYDPKCPFAKRQRGWD